VTLAALQAGDAATIAAARSAWSRIERASTFEDWVAVARALADRARTRDGGRQHEPAARAALHRGDRPPLGALRSIALAVPANIEVAIDLLVVRRNHGPSRIFARHIGGSRLAMADRRLIGRFARRGSCSGGGRSG
jgi:hypothetical protein